MLQDLCKRIVEDLECLVDIREEEENGEPIGYERVEDFEELEACKKVQDEGRPM